MKKIAVFPGSFDPITIGHESIVRRSLVLFDEVIVAIGVNSQKKNLFSAEQRMEWIQLTFKDCMNVRTELYSGLTVKFCKKVNASFIIRGLRTTADFEFESNIGQVNRKLVPDLETIYLLADPEHAFIHSSIVREIIIHKGDVSAFVPAAVKIIPTK